MKSLNRIPLFSILLLLCILAYGSNSRKGVDISVLYPAQTYKCFRNNGMGYAFVRAFKQEGVLDKDANISLTRVKEAGLYPQLYMEPCRGKSAQSQVEQLVSGIDPSLYHTIMIKVDTNPSPGCSWSQYDADSNCQFLKQLHIYIFKSEKVWGIFSSKKKWENVFGSATGCILSPPFNPYLWYSNIDKDPSFSNYEEFGGMTRPHMKQYDEDVAICGAHVNLNYLP